jgi:cell division protein ZapA (FtsZ GTPase activity inhibitor)
VPTVTHELQIAGQKLTIRTAAERDYVQRLAEMVESRVVRSSARGAALQSAALLAALDLADELVRAQEAHDALVREVQSSADEALAALDEAGET